MEDEGDVQREIIPQLHTHLHQMESPNAWSTLQGMELKPYCRTWASCNDSGGATFMYLQN